MVHFYTPCVALLVGAVAILTTHAAIHVVRPPNNTLQ